MKVFGFNITRSAASNKAFRPKARGQYKIVDDSSHIIEQSTTETRGEDDILDHSKRLRLLDLTRNLVRNSSLFNTILGQMTTNVVSSMGGKVILNFDDDKLNETLRKLFSNWTRNADFYTGDTFNHLLKRVLREYVIGGECVLLFDDGLIEDSGRILLFEANEIVDVPVGEIEKRYGEGSTISQGKVYSKFGRHIGTVVTKSQKGLGLDKIDPNKCYYLKKDPDANPLDSHWYHFSCNWREGRGISQAASAIGTIHQLEDLVTSELLASRRNSQIFCWLTETKQQEQLPTAFSYNDFSNMSDEEVENAVKEEASSTPVISFNKARENSVVYEKLPEGIDAKQLQMTHPNTNIEVMVDWLANRCASTLGLSRVFATGNPEDTNWRSNQLFSYPAILELQKDLEQVCDWCFYRFSIWNGSKIDVDDMKFVSWTWKGIDDLDPVSSQMGIQMALKNGTKTYKDILGADWKEKMSQTAEERDWLKAHGITHPADLMLSGGQTEGSKIDPDTGLEKEQLDYYEAKKTKSIM